MFESGTWLHITFGIALGIATTIFAYRTTKILKLGKNIRSHIGSLILYTISVVFIVYLYATATSGGLLIQWQLIGHPSVFGEEGYKIIEVGYVKSQSGKIYHWTNPYSRLDGQWEQVDAITYDPEQSIVSECKNQTLSFLPRKRNDFVDFKKACVFWGLGSNTTAYGVDDRGDVYLWFQGGGEYSGLERVTDPIYGGVLSCGLGVLLTAMLAGINFLKHKISKEA